MLVGKLHLGKPHSGKTRSTITMSHSSLGYKLDRRLGYVRIAIKKPLNGLNLLDWI